MSGVLERIVASTRADVERRRAALPPERLKPVARSPHAFRDALVTDGLAIIAEHKRRSPSAGQIRADASVAEIVAAYARGGAAAISVLTEERHFGGSLADLEAARAATELPLLRKDFVVDPYQLREAAAAGADAVLLIVAALEPSALAALLAQAAELGLDVLVEVHDRSELELALALDPAIVGVNNRDLRDFSVDVSRTFELLAEIPAGVVIVSESGLESPQRLAELRDAGVHAALIGEALMRAADPEAALRALL
jgi:indole-3-glycerol phosphate synthase